MDMEMGEAYQPCLGCQHPELIWSTLHYDRREQRSANSALMLCLSSLTGLVQYSLSADPECPAAGNEPEEFCSDHRGRRGASV